MIHKDRVENYEGTMQNLVEDIGDLKYNALAEFLNLLSQKIENDGIKDAERKRFQLAKQLQNCADNLKEAKITIDKAWKISEPYMK